MPLPNILEFIGTNITQRKFQQAMDKLLNFTDELDKRQSATANGYYKSYATLSDANADIANIPLNVSVRVLSQENGGDYYKASAGATSLTKSPYDPLAISKAAIEEKVTHESGEHILVAKDSNGTPVFLITKNGEYFFIGLDGDLVSELKKLDVSDKISSENDNNIFVIKDAYGRETLKQTQNGDLILANIGNLTQIIGQLKNSQSEVVSNQNIEYLHKSAKYTDYALTETLEPLLTYDYLLKASDVDALNVFNHPVAFLRIPAITRIQKNKYLLFFEARAELSDFSRISQGVATVIVDVETDQATVSDVKSLHDAYDEAGVMWTMMNACATKLKSGRIICLYVKRNGTTEHRLLKVHSDDDGETWSSPVDLSIIYAEKRWNLVCPCSQGLVKRYGKNKGRIVFPVWTTGVAYNTSDFRSGYVYSDDHGETWQLGQFTTIAMTNEVQVAEDLNGDLLFCVRIETQATPKILLKLKDGASEYEVVQSSTKITDAIIMSSLIQGDNEFDGSSAKFMLATAKNLNRTGLLIHTSYDGGLNWKTYDHPNLLTIPVAYTCIENITISKKFVMWETNTTRDFSYSIISLKNLIEDQ